MRTFAAGDLHISEVLDDGSFSPPYVPYNIPPNPQITEQIKQALLDRPTNVRTRIVLLDGSCGKHNYTLLDLIGLAFDIEPLFFESLHDPHEPKFRNPGFLWMGQMLMKMVTNVSATSKPLSVVFVYFDSSYVWETKNLFMIKERPSLLDQDTQSTAPRKRFLSEYDIYQSMMRAQKNSSSKEDQLQCLAIMARLHLVLFRQRISVAANGHRQSRGVGVGKDKELVYEIWEEFREQLAFFQDSVRSFSRFTAQAFSELELNKSLSEIRNDQDNTIAEAQSLEARMRDILQINTSRLALVESRNTIAEGKGSKLLTSLTFVLLPISWSTSVFGMNVQQINSSGKYIRVFITTAAVLTILAIGGWALSNAFQHRWDSMNHEKVPLSRRLGNI
ncbi:hypothetical protein MMC07_007232, partial [Pseudocyphellaria aurata]|nr:hypothetical protein [Pseudocyphellaria aurata]